MGARNVIREIKRSIRRRYSPEEKILIVVTFPPEFAPAN